MSVSKKKSGKGKNPKPANNESPKETNVIFITEFKHCVQANDQGQRLWSEMFSD